MSRHQMTSKRPDMVAAAAFVTLLSMIAISGCSEAEKREYATPRSLCGTAIDTDEIAPFLPSGRNITVRDDSYTAIKGCEVIVDKKLVISTTQAWLEKGRTTAYFAAGQTLDTPKNSVNEGRFRYSGNEAFGKTQGCVDTRYKQELYTAVQAQGSDHRDADAMKRLIISYTKEVEKSAECTAGSL